MSKFKIKNKIILFAVTALIFALSAVMLFGCTGTEGGGGVDIDINFGGGGVVGTTPDGGKYKVGDVITLPNCTLTKPGHVFAGWTDGDGVVYQAGETYTVKNEAVTFTATWVPEKLAVRFFDDDGTELWSTNIPYSHGLTSGYQGEEPQVPESDETGYQYVWDADDGWEPAIPQTFTQNTDFRAKFIKVANQYSYQFYNTDNEKYGVEKLGAYGSPLFAPTTAPIKTASGHVERYEFIGWRAKREPESAARMPDANGAIGTVAGDAKFYPVYKKIDKIYTFTLLEKQTGYLAVVSDGVPFNGEITIDVTLEDDYSQSTPTASVAYVGGKIVAITMTRIGGNLWRGVVVAEGDGIVSIAKVQKNRYTVKPKVVDSKITGLKKDGYVFGEVVSFTFESDQSDRDPDIKITVTSNTGEATRKDLTGIRRETGGIVYYDYSFVCGGTTILDVIGVDAHTVTFVYPDGTKKTAKFTNGSQAVLPTPTIGLQYNETASGAEYVSGWKVGERTVLEENMTQEIVTGNVTYTALTRKRYYTANINNKKYLFLETAIEAATAGNTIDIMLPGADTAIELGGKKVIPFDRPGRKKTYELAADVTMRLPYGSELFSNFADGDKTRYNPTAVFTFADTNPALLYLNVVLGANIILNVYGKVEIGGIVSQPGINIQGHTSGEYAQLTVNGQLNVYGELKTFGYVKGSGNLEAFSGANCYAPFVIRDYRGGTNTVTVAHKNDKNKIICPFNVYEFPNIQPAKYTVWYGAAEYGYASLYASSKHNATVAKIISKDDEDGIIRLLTKESKVEKMFDESTHVAIYRISGDAKDGALLLTISVGSVSSGSFLLPVPYLMSLVLTDGSVFTMGYGHKFMPGSSLTVEEGATLTVAAGAQMIGYQEYVPDESKYTGTDGIIASFKATEYNVFYPGNTPATFRIDGTLIVSGTLGGALTGTGSVRFDEKSIISMSSFEGNSGVTTAIGAMFGGGKFCEIYSTTQAARGKVGGVLTYFQPGNTYRLS